ncbi:MAG: cell division protein FtsX [bacterium]
MQSLAYCFKEGFEGIRRSRFSGFVTTATITISLILIGTFLIVTFNLNRVLETLRKRVELEVFLDDSLDEFNIRQLADEIKEIEGVAEAIFISKEKAALEFNELFRGKEANYFETLGYNPLPASFRIILKKDYRNSKGIERIYQSVSNIEGIHKEDIIYRRRFMMMLEKYINIAIAVDLIFGVIVCLSALLLVSNNIRLIILAKQRIIETMRLVGSTQFFIEMPLYIQGSAQGLWAGILASLILYGLLLVANLEIPDYVSVTWQIYLILILLGASLGISGSFIAIRKHLR